jgi:hypothetical protein
VNFNLNKKLKMVKQNFSEETLPQAIKELRKLLFERVESVDKHNFGKSICYSCVFILLLTFHSINLLNLTHKWLLCEIIKHVRKEIKKRLQ